MVPKIFGLKRSRAKKAEPGRADARKVEWKVRRPLPRHFQKFEELGEVLTKAEKYKAFRRALSSIDKEDRKKAGALWEDLSIMMGERLKMKDARRILWCEAPDALRKAMVREGRRVLENKSRRLKK